MLDLSRNVEIIFMHKDYEIISHDLQNVCLSVCLSVCHDPMSIGS